MDAVYGPGVNATYGTDIPTAILSGVAMIWAGALVVLDKRHLIRHTLTMLSGACLLVSMILDILIFHILNTMVRPLYGLFSVMARYLLWCIAYEVLRTCMPGSKRSLKHIIIMIAYTWSAIGTILSIVYVILYASPRYLDGAGPIIQRIAWYGSVPLILGLYILSFSQDFKTAVQDFRRTYAVLGLLLTVISAGVIIETVSSAALAARILDTLVMSLALILICACAPRWVGMKHNRLTNQSGDEEDNFFGHDHTQETDNIYNNTGNNHDSRYDPDDVYTKEAQDVGRF